MKYFVAISITSVVLTATAVAETPEERNACMGDAFRICWSAIPDRDRVTACMAMNKSQLGPACRAVIARYSRPDVEKETRSPRRIIKSEDAHADPN